MLPTVRCMCGEMVRISCRSTHPHPPIIPLPAFDVDAPHCNGVYPPNMNGDNASCFRHAWDTPEARARLLAACTIPGREVTRIFLAGIRDRIRHGNGKNADGVCDPALMALLDALHAKGIAVYGLFAASNEAFSEQDFVGDLNLFNRNCGSANFDGASVNNEYFSSIARCGAGNERAQRTLLDNLSNTANNAAPLPLHFSISWNWWCCDCARSTYTERLLEWNGVTKNVVGHMIDTVDSVDVQVAWNTGNVMADRATNPYQYWNSHKLGQTSTTALYVLAYTNPVSDCRLSFSPHVLGATSASDTCATGDRTEEGMFTAFDEIESELPNAIGAIHFMDGVYSSGMSGWPRHVTNGSHCSAIRWGRACRRDPDCSWARSSRTCNARS